MHGVLLGSEAEIDGFDWTGRCEGVTLDAVGMSNQRTDGVICYLSSAEIYESDGAEGGHIERG